MKRLFSKAIFAALIIGLVPAQSAQAHQSSMGTAAITSALIGGVAGYLLSTFVSSSYAKESDKARVGLDFLAQATANNFSNHNYNPTNMQPGPDGAWDEDRIAGHIAFIPNLSFLDRTRLVAQVKSYRKDNTQAKRTDIIQTCNAHKTRIATEATRNSMLAQIGLPIIGAICGFFYSWLGK